MLSAGAVACGSIERRPRLATCAPGWTAVGAMNNNPAKLPRGMAWRDGLLYQATPSSVMAMSAADGKTVALLSSSPATAVWVEGEDVVYAVGDKLSAVALADGSERLLLDGGQHNDPSSGTSGQDHVGDQQQLDAAAFYWTTTAYPYASDGSHVWRMLRDGGAVEGFAQMPIATVDALAIRADAVLAVGQSTTLGGAFYRAFLAPFGHGPAREVAMEPAPDRILSADGGALLWTVWDGHTSSGDGYSIWWLPADGSTARPVSHDLPAELSASWSASDGRGGHVIGGVEPFDDGAMHASVFEVNADGAATRLGCDPSDNWPVYGAATVAPDGVYLAVRYEPRTWRLVKLALAR
jgi:hypothetical protein